MISFCGINCAKCEAFKEKDDEKRKEIAEKWAKEYNHPGLKPEDINCNGCTSTSNTLFSHCRVCEIRKCGLNKGLENCAHCNEYACDKLKKFHKHAPNAKETLDKIALFLRT